MKTILLILASICLTQLKAQTIDKNYVINWIKAINTSYQPDSVIQYHIDRDTYYTYDTLEFNSRLRQIDISSLKSIFYSKYKMDNYVPGKGTIYILTIKKLKTDGVSDDEIKIGEGEVQKLTDTFIVNVDRLTEVKEKDIMTI